MTETTANSTKKMAVLVFLIGITFVLHTLKSLIIPLLLAVIFAILIFPIQIVIERKLKFNRLFATISSIFILFVVTLFLTITIIFQLQNLFDDTSLYVDKLSQIYENFIEGIEHTFHISKRYSLLNQNFNFGAFLKRNFDQISSFALEWGTVLSNLILIPIYMFFFLYYRKFFRTFAYKLFKSKTKSIINSVILKVYNIQRNYLMGLLKVILIVGVLNSIGLLFLGIDNAIFFGFFGAILLVVPYVGIIVGSLLPALIALVTKDSYWYTIGVIAVFGIIQFFEGYLITPQIVGDKVSVNAFAAILALLGFAMLWGVAGMVVALPVTATLKILLDHSKNYEAYGFIIGAPNDKLLRSEARHRLKKRQNNK